MERLFLSVDIAISFSSSLTDLLLILVFLLMNKTSAQRWGKCLLQPQDINIKQSLLRRTSQRPAVCGEVLE